MSITYPPEMLPIADEDADVFVQNSDGSFRKIELCRKTEVEGEGTNRPQSDQRGRDVESRQRDETPADPNDASVLRLQNECLRTLLDDLLRAVEPFANGYIAQQVDGEGWTSNIHRDPISTWFGPSEFRALTEAYLKTKGE